MPQPRESMLAAFLADAFAEDELRRWVHNSLGAKAYRDLPGKGTSLNEIAFQVALLVSKYGGDDEELFESLRQERPGLTDRIQAVAEHWSAADHRIDGEATTIEPAGQAPSRNLAQQDRTARFAEGSAVTASNTPVPTSRLQSLIARSLRPR